MTMTTRTITTTTAELDRALDALRIAVERAESAIGTDESAAASAAIDNLVDLMPRTTLVDRLIRSHLDGGCLLGMLTVGRHVERECERAYLSGHVDGYAKAVHEAHADQTGEEPK